MTTKIFQSSSMTKGHPGYPERSGQDVTVLRPLGEDEYYGVEVEAMYRIRFADGVETDAFESELV